MFPDLYSPIEPVYFLGFFYLLDPDPDPGPGGRSPMFMRIRADPDPKHWSAQACNEIVQLFAKI